MVEFDGDFFAFDAASNPGSESFDDSELPAGPAVLTTPRLGGDEMNLAEFPFALLADRQSPGLTSLEFSDTIRGPGGEAVTRVWTVTGAEEFGLPVASDEEVYIALMEVTREQGFATRSIHVTRYDLINRLGWPDKGQSYRRLRGAFDRLLGVTITAQRAFWDRRQQRYVDLGFHILDDYVLYDEQPGRKQQGGRVYVPLSYVSWNQIIFQSFQAGNLKQLDVGFYFSLRSALSRRLFRYLDKKRLDGKPAFRIGLRKLGFEKLGMSRNYYPSHLKQELARAHEELQRNGFLTGAEYVRAGVEAEEHVLYHFPPAPDRQRAGSLTEAGAALLRRLVEAGMTRAVAEKLVRQYPERVGPQLDYLPYRGAQDPAALLVEAIRGDWAAPALYLQAQAEGAEARREAEARRVVEERRRDQEQARRERGEHLEERLSVLPLEEYDQLYREARSRLQSLNPTVASRPDTPAYDVLLRETVYQLLEEG
ncbi:MAG TPA: replication initiator protein A [Armatimonadota bacterium]|jgi:hypothetical protein